MNMREIVQRTRDKKTCVCSPFFRKSVRVRFFVYNDEDDRIYSVEFIGCMECGRAIRTTADVSTYYHAGDTFYLPSAVPEKVTDAIDSVEHIIVPYPGILRKYTDSETHIVEEITPLVSVCGEVIWLQSAKKKKKRCEKCARIFSKMYSIMLRGHRDEY